MNFKARLYHKVFDRKVRQIEQPKTVTWSSVKKVRRRDLQGPPARDESFDIYEKRSVGVKRK